MATDGPGMKMQPDTFSGPWTIGTSVPLHTLWVEGLQATGANDVEFTLTVTPGGGPAQPPTVPTDLAVPATVKARTPLIFGFYGADIGERGGMNDPNQEIERVANPRHWRLFYSKNEAQRDSWQFAYANFISRSSQDPNQISIYLDTNRDGRYDPKGYWTKNGHVFHSGIWTDPKGVDHPPDDPRSIRIFGYSWGGLSAILLSRKIGEDTDFTHQKQGAVGNFTATNTVDIVAVIDPVRKLRNDRGGVGSNVQFFWNRYESKTLPKNEETNIFGPIHGYLVGSQAGQSDQKDMNDTGLKNMHVRPFLRINHVRIVYDEIEHLVNVLTKNGGSITW